MNFKELEKACLGEFEANSDLFKTTVKDSIEKNRKGRKNITIKDKNGEPISGARVKVKLVNHEFKHGAHLFMLDQFESQEENLQYRELFPDYFNLGTVPFYWAELEPQEGKPRYDADSENIYRRPSPDLCLNYCREKGIDAKIHCLFYDKFIPGWLPKTNAEKMRTLYEKRFKEIAERYGDGVMYEIEVLNELIETPYWTTNSVLSDTEDALEWSFNLAEKYFPNDVLVINDGNFVPEIGKHTYRHPYYLLIDGAIAKGVRIDKIGIQNHIYIHTGELNKINDVAPYYDPKAILKGLEVMSEFKKPLEITEISIPTLGEGIEAENLQAEVLKYLYTLWFSSKNLESAVYWNSVENTAYSAPGADENKLCAGLFHRNLTPKKSAQMLKYLFNKEWHTEEELVSDENGQISFVGFHGDYQVSIQSLNTSDLSTRLYKKSQNSEIVIG